MPALDADGRRQGHARRGQQLDHVAIGVARLAVLRREAAPAGAANVFDAVGAIRHRRVDLVRGHRHAGLVRGLDDALLQEIRQPDVGLDEVEAQRLRTGDLPVDQRSAVERHAAGIVDAGAVERLAGGDHPRSNPRAGLERLTILDPLERVGRRVANRRDPERQPDPSQHLAVLLRQVGVTFDQPRQHRGGPGVDDDAAVQIVTMRRHLHDAVALDDDVHVLGDGGAAAIEQPSGMHGRGPRGPPGRPRELRHDVAHAAVGEIHQAEPIERLVQHVPRVGGPRRRAGIVGRHAARRTRR